MALIVDRLHDPGRRVDDSATTPTVTTTALDYTEDEWSLVVTAAAVATETYEFRVLRGEVPIAATVTPSVTIATGGTTLPASPATEADSAGAATLAKTAAAGPATEADTAASGTLVKTLDGPASTEDAAAGPATLTRQPTAAGT